MDDGIEQRTVATLVVSRSNHSTISHLHRKLLETITQNTSQFPGGPLPERTGMRKLERNSTNAMNECVVYEFM